jgi:purine nucleoside phosphorylase
MADTITDAVAAVRARTRATPAVALILGSGLGGLADEVEEAVAIPFAEIPGAGRGYWERVSGPRRTLRERARCRK